MDPKARNPWHAEGAAIDFDDCDFDVAHAAELPDELSAHGIAAAADADFDDEFWDWFGALYEPEEQIVLLALDQSCDEGILLPWDMRGVRLWSAPPEAISKLHWFWDKCPRHIAAYVAHYNYWLVRAERARRRGSPEWSPRHPLPPVEEEHAYFRPSTLVFRRQL